MRQKLKHAHVEHTTRCVGIQKKQEEKLLVAEANCIPDERTMVIHTEDYATESATMMSAVWLVRPRFAAPTSLPSWLHRHNTFRLCHFCRWRTLTPPFFLVGDLTRVCIHCRSEAREEHEDQCVKNNARRAVESQADSWHVGKDESVVQHDHDLQHEHNGQVSDK
jgi:hypothetical protein